MKAAALKALGVLAISVIGGLGSWHLRERLRDMPGHCHHDSIVRLDCEGCGFALRAFVDQRVIADVTTAARVGKGP